MITAFTGFYSLWIASSDEYRLNVGKSLTKCSDAVLSFYEKDSLRSCDMSFHILKQSKRQQVDIVLFFAVFLKPSGLLVMKIA
jgi:hypothetical protein